MIRVIQHICAKLYEWTMAALETGVECRADVVCLHEPARGRVNVGISHATYEMRRRKRVWMAIQKGSGLVVDVQTDLNSGANNDVIATDVRRTGEKIPRIVNVYDQRDGQSGERPAPKLNWQRVIRQRSTVLAGDFNAHSRRWDPRCRGLRNVAFWEEMIDENELEIGNDGQSTHNWTREGHEGKSVIDLTLANRPITKWSTLADDHATGSDHEVIEWVVDVDRQEEKDHQRVAGWNLAAMTEKDAEAAEELWTDLARE